MPLGNRVKTDELYRTYDDEVYPLGTTYVQIASEVAGIDLEKADGSTAFTVATPSAANLQQGDRTWIFVQAKTGVVAGDLCKRDTTAAGTPFLVAKDAGSETNKILLRGVAQFDIDTGKYGWVCAKGTVVVQTKTGVAAAAVLASDGNTTAGEVDAFTINPGTNDSGSAIGVALDAESGSSRYGAGFCQAIIDLL